MTMVRLLEETMAEKRRRDYYNYVALETLAAKRRPLSHSKSLGREIFLVVGPIDKELLGMEEYIKKLEITAFDWARIIKELESNIELLQREAGEEEQTGILYVKAERVETESNEARAMELEAQMFDPERARAI